MEENKVLIAMSGGVDSSVAAFLMRQAGFDCEGAILRLLPDCPENPQVSAIEDARSVAATTCATDARSF